MKKLSSRLLIVLAVFLMPLTSCNLNSSEAPTAELLSGDFTDIPEALPAATEAPPPIAEEPATVTEAPPTITETPTQMIPLPTQPPPKQTTNLNVDASNLSNKRFEVPHDTDLTVSDISSDGKVNNCSISKSGTNKSIPITLPIGQPSGIIQLPSGEYKLNCGVPNINAVIVSK